MHRFFKRHEFKCKCGDCNCDTVDAVLLRELILARMQFGPIIIRSGHRCRKHNDSEEVGGGRFSQHLLGKAADLNVRNYSPQEVYDYFDERWPHTFGLGLYDWGVHFDVRNIKARW